MGIDGHCWLPEGGVQYDVGRLSSDTGQSHEFVTRLRDFTSVAFQQELGHFDDIFSFAVKQADGFDVLLQAFFSERKYLGGRVCDGKQLPGGFIYAYVGSLR
jgi:hypothetical protein